MSARPPTLLLHGFTGSAEAWGAELREGLGKGTRVLAVDLPGHGARARAPEPPGSIQEALGEVVGELDAAGVERADWIGYSMGGRLALAGAILHPDRVDRLVLESASPGLASPEERALRRERDEALARRIEEEGIEPFVREWMALPLFASQKQLPPPVLEEARRIRLANDPAGLARALRSFGTGVQPGFWDRLGELRRPTLLLTGALDLKFEAIAGRMAEAIPEATRVSVPGVGHAPHLEAPGRWLEVVLEFLARSQCGESELRRISEPPHQEEG